MKSTSILFFFIILFFTPLLFVQAQSKKEQIETLIFQKDSLFIILEKERQLNSDQVKGLKVRNQALNDSLVRIIEKERQTSIDIVKLLEDKISNLNSAIALIQKELIQSNKELAVKEEKILGNQLDQVIREDSIRGLREELHQIKSSKFEFFLPYFLNEAVSGKNFDSLIYVSSPITEKFINKKELGFGRFVNLTMWCNLYGSSNPNPEGGNMIYGFVQGLPSHEFRPNLSILPYFAKSAPALALCEEQLGSDGIYYHEVKELIHSTWNESEEIIEKSYFERLENFEKMKVEIIVRGYLIKTFYFIDYKNRWYLLYVDDCDCSS
jgi:hypothetical protein